MTCSAGLEEGSEVERVCAVCVLRMEQGGRSRYNLVSASFTPHVKFFVALRYIGNKKPLGSGRSPGV